ncbi:MAG TPA: universal stress protein [Symbiobacteriaceae bacterium]|nr:universal stress protein [Symbiobacteriaceae bacterium]
MKKVLLATDGSDSSMHAARVLGDLIANQPEAQVTVLHVAHVPRSYFFTDENGNKVTPEVPMDIMIRRSAEPIFRRTLSALGLPEDRVVTEVQVGEPAEEIVDLARLEGYELIVLGCRGIGQMKELLIGSVSHRVLHTAPCPVLVAR